MRTHGQALGMSYKVRKAAEKFDLKNIDTERKRRILRISKVITELGQNGITIKNTFALVLICPVKLIFLHLPAILSAKSQIPQNSKLNNLSRKVLNNY